MQKPNSHLLLKFSLLANVLAVLIALGVVFWMGGWKHFYAKLKNRGLSEQYAMQIDQLNLLPQDSMDLVFLGNSLIANGHWGEWFGDQKVANRGISGDGIEGVLGRLETVKRLRPEKLFLLIGINDLAFHSEEWLLERYENLLRQLKVELPGTKVWVQSILPVNNSVKETGHANETISLVNSELESMAKRHEIGFLNLHPIFADQKGRLKAEWTLDGIHLTGTAYQFWSDFLRKEVLLKTDKLLDK